MANYCGGILLGDTLQLKNGVITLASNDENIDSTTTACGQLWDASIFMEANLGTSRPILTSIGVEEGMDVPEPIRSNCGLLLDSRYFTVDDRAVNFTERYLLEVFPTPSNATVTVTHTDIPVDPLGDTLIFPLDENGGTYEVTVEAEGYTTQTQEIEATENQLLEVELVAV